MSVSARPVDQRRGLAVTFGTQTKKFDRRLDEIFAVQDRVVQTIVSTLVGRVQISDTNRARRTPPTILAAYECVLKGNALSWDDPVGVAEAHEIVREGN